MNADDPLGRFLLGFGEDEDGEIYVLTSTNLAPTGAAGEVFRLGPEPFILPGLDIKPGSDPNSINLGKCPAVSPLRSPFRQRLRYR